MEAPPVHISAAPSRAGPSPAAPRPPRTPPGLPAAPARPLPRGWWPSRIAAPRPRRIEAGEGPDGGPAGVLACCAFFFFNQPPAPALERFRGQRDCSRGRRGGRHAGVYLRRLPVSQVWGRHGGLGVVSPPRARRRRVRVCGKACVCAGGGCQFVFHEPRKSLVFKANVNRLHSIVASVLNLGSAASAHQGQASPLPRCPSPSALPPCRTPLGRGGLDRPGDRAPLERAPWAVEGGTRGF